VKQIPIRRRSWQLAGAHQNGRDGIQDQVVWAATSLGAACRNNNVAPHNETSGTAAAYLVLKGNNASYRPIAKNPMRGHLRKSKIVARIYIVRIITQQSALDAKKPSGGVGDASLPIESGWFAV
jgi:hypothetical protein